MSVKSEGEIINVGIAKMAADTELKERFMVAMSGSKDEIEEFYIKYFDAPQDLASQLASKSGSDLWTYIGERVCTDLW